MKLNRWTDLLQGRTFRNITNENWDILEKFASDYYLEIQRILGIINDKEATLYRYVIAEDNKVREKMKAEDDALRGLITDSVEHLEGEITDLGVQVNNRVDNLINSTPQPSEVVDARTDSKGFAHPSLRAHLVAMETTIDSKLQVFYSLDEVPKMRMKDWLLLQSGVVNDVQNFIYLNAKDFPLTFVKEVAVPALNNGSVIIGNLGDNNFPITEVAKIRLSSAVKFGTATYIYGIYVGNITAFKTVVDGIPYSGGDPAADGTFKIYVSGRVLATSINVEVIAYANGKEMAKMQVFNNVIK
ncbi:immunoglobulin-like domain-containing protein [Listeria booriae]|uniref:immunoglobulin-like domain-containing protein n=1 Tax=Listeria booriae TaxID=1552123 RepID=UPI001624132F|nr:immunoglobulin-like domain-containing protein [Listeria booriae]MBC1272693.1 hypothetical protein [Listeria booriae]